MLLFWGFGLRFRGLRNLLRVQGFVLGRRVLGVWAEVLVRHLLFRIPQKGP